MGIPLNLSALKTSIFLSKKCVKSDAPFLDKNIAGTDVNVGLISDGDYLRGQTANLVSRVSDTASGLE